MLTWNVTYHCKKGKRADFYHALCELGIRENSQAEEGNCRYDYYFAAEAPDDLLLVELDKPRASEGSLRDPDLCKASGAQSSVLREC